MNALVSNDRNTVLFAGLVLGGLALGAFFWLWSGQGAAVYLNYLAGAAFTCF